MCANRRGCVQVIGGVYVVVCGGSGWGVEGLADLKIDVFYDSFRPF